MVRKFFSPEESAEFIRGWTSGVPIGVLAQRFGSTPAALRCRASNLRIARPKRTFDLVRHIHRQVRFSKRTFGPGAHVAGILDHIRKELAEIEAAPADVYEWVDLILLGLDGAWRAGFEPEEICRVIAAKQVKNETRKWPDWRTADLDKAIRHVGDS